VRTVGAQTTEGSRKNEPNGSVLSITSSLRCTDVEEDMLNRFVTGDDSWVQHYQPESKLASTQWKHLSSHSRSTRKVEVTPSAGKVMFIVFWDSQGVLLAHFQNRGENVYSAEL
jgi:hypothetical protein